MHESDTDITGSGIPSFRAKSISRGDFLIPVLFSVSIGFLLLYLSDTGRNISEALNGGGGVAGFAGSSFTRFLNLYYGPLFIALFLLVYLYLRIRLSQADPFLLPAVVILSGIGLIMTIRLSPDLALLRSEAIQSFLARYPDAPIRDNTLTLARLGTRHLFSIAVGVFVMFLSVIVFNRKVLAWLSSKKYLWVFLSAVLIIVTLSLGTRINQRRLWLFGFQTVEIVKLLMVFFVAGFLYEKGKGIAISSRKGWREWFGYGGPFVLMWFFALVPLFIQKDLGPTFLIFLVLLLMFYYGGNPNLVTVSFAFLIIIGGTLSYSIGFPSIVRDRFDMMLDPFGRNESIARSLWSISSGGIFGVGIGSGQAHRIPQVQSDFTFSAICEEMGFVGGIAVILAYAVIVHRCFKISFQAVNIYKKAVTACIGMLIGIQAFVIISGNLGILPLTGITLPLVSYGGSSMVMSFLMIGIVIRISGEKDA